MAERKKEPSTINSRMNSHSIFVSVVLAFMCVCLVLVVIVYARIYNRMIDGSYCLEKLFDEIKNLQTITVEYVSSDSEDGKEDIAELLSAIREDIALLQTLPVEGNFPRNLTDLSKLMDSYETIQNKVLLTKQQLLEEGRTQEIVDETLEEYSKMETIYSAVMNRKDFLVSELSVYLNQQNQSLEGELYLFFSVVMATFVIGIILVWMNTRQLAYEIYLPIKRLTKQAEKISKGDLDTAMPEDFREKEDESEPSRQIAEMVVLNDTFTLMLGRIQKQIAELKDAMAVREQLKEQKMENLRIANLLTTSELRCLQSQMNPHFLFNTLNMIQQTIYLDKKEKSSFLLKETAAFLRYSLDYAGKNVPLSRELEALGNYISLQEERLGDRILFEFDLDERINKMTVPSFIR